MLLLVSNLQQMNYYSLSIYCLHFKTYRNVLCWHRNCLPINNISNFNEGPHTSLGGHLVRKPVTIICRKFTLGRVISWKPLKRIFFYFSWLTHSICCHGSQSIFRLLTTIASPLPRRLSSLHLSSWTTCDSPCIKSITSCSFFLYVSNFIYFFICLGGLHTIIHVLRSEDNLQESVSSPWPLCGSQESNLDDQAAWQAFSPAMPSWWTLIFFLHIISYKGAERLPY